MMAAERRVTVREVFFCDSVSLQSVWSVLSACSVVVIGKARLNRMHV